MQRQRGNLTSPRVTGRPESGARRAEKAQETQDAETTATHAKSDKKCSEFTLVDMSRRMEDFLC